MPAEVRAEILRLRREARELAARPDAAADSRQVKRAVARIAEIERRIAEAGRCRGAPPARASTAWRRDGERTANKAGAAARTAARPAASAAPRDRSALSPR